MEHPVLSYKAEETGLELHSKFTLSDNDLINSKNVVGLAA
jgi:hypothetical protein